MKYKGIEIKEITEAQVFDPPKEMLVWDADDEEPSERNVCAIIKNRNFPVISEHSSWAHCANVPKPKALVTHRELARWLAEGKGEMRRGNLTMTFTDLAYDFSMTNDPIDEHAIVRKWDDTGWHSPTREYLGLEDK